MPTTGAYEFRRAAAADERGVVSDENRIGRGEWGWIDRTATDRRWLSIYLRCPDCGILATLWRSFGDHSHGHAIDPQGNIHPSVGCPHNDDVKMKCGFHTQPTRLLDFVDRRSV